MSSVPPLFPSHPTSNPAGNPVGSAFGAHPKSRRFSTPPLPPRCSPFSLWPPDRLLFLVVSMFVSRGPANTAFSAHSHAQWNSLVWSCMAGTAPHLLLGPYWASYCAQPYIYLAGVQAPRLRPPHWLILCPECFPRGLGSSTSISQSFYRLHSCNDNVTQ